MSIKGGDKIELKLAKMAKSLEDYTKPFTKAGEDIVVYIGIRIFEQGGFPDERWEPLSAATISKRVQGVGWYSQSNVSSMDKILIWTGQLRSGFHKKVETTSVTIYNDVPYFKNHQLGYHTKKRTMLKLDQTMVKLVEDRINEYIKSLL